MLALLRASGRVLLTIPRGRAWIPVVLWLALITLLSSRSSEQLSGMGWSTPILNVGHAALFGLLALWMALGLPRTEGWPRLDAIGVRRVLVLVLVCGALDETHQLLGGRGRTSSVLDVVTDVTGAACVLWVARRVADPAATANQVGLRLLVSLVLCLAAGGLATAGPLWFPGIPWL